MTAPPITAGAATVARTPPLAAMTELPTYALVAETAAAPESVEIAVPVPAATPDTDVIAIAVGMATVVAAVVTAVLAIDFEHSALVRVAHV